MANTSIEWTRGEDGSEGRTWNPIRARNKETGGVGHFCEKLSPGCANCYSATMQKRFRNKIRFNAADRDKVDLFLDENVLTAPLRWRKASKVFVCSMTDLFGEFVPGEWLDRIFAVMALASRHTFQVLTKRPERMREYVEGMRLRNSPDGNFSISPATVLTQGAMSTGLLRDAAALIQAVQTIKWPLPNVWLGTSVENQPTADERIPLLLRTPAAVRFISAEPLLGPIDFEPWLTDPNPQAFISLSRYYGPNGFDPTGSQVAKTRVVNPKFDWLIVGGESGRGARPMDIAWARFIVRQCEAAGVPCFVKHLGAKVAGRDCEHGREGKACSFLDSKGGDPEEWPADLRVRQFPATPPEAATAR